LLVSLHVLLDGNQVTLGALLESRVFFHRKIPFSSFGSRQFYLLIDVINLQSI